jgi:hypothetical protein
MSTQSSKTSANSNFAGTVAGFNPRAVAALFRMEVEDAFNAWNASRPMRTGYPHASNILSPEADFCLRKLVLMAAYPDEAVRPEAKPWDSHQNMVFKSGWSLHEKYQDLLHKFSTVVVDERGRPELDLTHFDFDNLIFFSPDIIQNHFGEAMPVEIKGYKHSTFEKLDEMGAAPTDACKQVNLYMYLLELRHGLILVEDKDTQYIKVWCVEYDKELVAPYIARMDAFMAAYNAITLNEQPAPERKCKSPNDRMAQKCEMRDYCFSHR